MEQGLLLLMSLVAFATWTISCAMIVVYIQLVRGLSSTENLVEEKIAAVLCSIGSIWSFYMVLNC